MIENISGQLWINPWILIMILIIFYFAPSFLATEYKIFSFRFFFNNLFFGWTPIPRTILIIKTLKNKNIIRDNDKKKLSSIFSKTEIEEIEKMKKDREERLKNKKEN